MPIITEFFKITKESYKHHWEEYYFFTYVHYVFHIGAWPGLKKQLTKLVWGEYLNPIVSFKIKVPGV